MLKDLDVRNKGNELRWKEDICDIADELKPGRFSFEISRLKRGVKMASNVPNGLNKSPVPFYWGFFPERIL